ncbi:MAG: hypothetical protein QM706_15960 [Nitrospira sp.]
MLKGDLPQMSGWKVQRRFPQGFEAWCRYIGNSPPHGFNPHADFIQYVDSMRLQPTPSALKQYISLITKEGVHWSNLKIYSPNSETGEWALHFNPQTNSAYYDYVTAESTDVWQLTVAGHYKALELIGLTAWNIHLQALFSNKPIRLVNCVIGSLNLTKIENTHRFSLELHHCWIGSLDLPQNCTKNLTINGGGIANINCPSAESPNPFTGDVILKNVFFPTCIHQTSLFEGSQAYRSLHAHLKKHDNIPAANLMRALHLHSERLHDKGFTKLTNWIYGTFADYGTSPGKPLRWILGFYALTCVIVYLWDQGTLVQDCNAYIGAYSSMRNEEGGRLVRSLLLPLHAIINPFGIFFDSRRLIVPSTGWGAFLLTIQGLCSDMLLVMTVLSIRRRFKTD